MDVNIFIFSSFVKERIAIKYQSHRHIYTDGSVLENNNTGAAFYIPALKVEKSFSLGKNVSIFTAEIVAIILALDYLISYPKTLLNVVFFVDSKSVLFALESFNLETRPDFVIEAIHHIHCLRINGTDITFCWVPSHVGIHGNEVADSLARKGANSSKTSTKINVSLSMKEAYTLLETTAWDSFQKHSNEPLMKQQKLIFPEHMFSTKSPQSTLYNTRMISTVFNRLSLDAVKTKYSKNVNCVCGEGFSLRHVLFDCNHLRPFLPKSFIENDFSVDNFKDIIKNSALMIDISYALIHSPVCA